MYCTLVYPSKEVPVYCRDCGDHILETDLFGRLRDKSLLCARCFDPLIQEYTKYLREKEDSLLRTFSGKKI